MIKGKIQQGRLSVMKYDFFRKFFLKENKKATGQIVTAFIFGILLLFGSSHFLTPKEVQTTKENDVPNTITQTECVKEQTRTERTLEQQMEQILSQIEGAGQVKVMLTYRTTKENVWAKEEISEKITKGEEESNRLEQKIVLSEDGKGMQSPLMVTEYAPQVEGVVIVAQGGENPTVSQALNSAAQALLEVPAHKIAVLKMKS